MWTDKEITRARRNAVIRAARNAWDRPDPHVIAQTLQGQWIRRPNGRQRYQVLRATWIPGVAADLIQLKRVDGTQTTCSVSELKRWRLT